MIALLEALLNALFGSKKPANIEPNLTPKEPEKTAIKPTQEVKMDSPIDWNNPSCKIAQYFTVKDALWLPQWNRLANEADGLNDEIKANLLKLFAKMDIVRSYVNKPIIVHVAYRPKEYNSLVKGATQSAHLYGQAVDWSSDVTEDKIRNGKDCDKLKELLEPCLEEWSLRMEDNGQGAGWIHLDTRQPGPAGRFFKP